MVVNCHAASSRCLMLNSHYVKFGSCCSDMRRTYTKNFVCNNAGYPSAADPTHCVPSNNYCCNCKDLINCKPHVTAVRKLGNWILTGIVLHRWVVYTLYLIIQLSIITSNVQDTSLYHLSPHSTLSPTPNKNPIYEIYEGWSFNSGKYLFTTDTK